MLYSNRQWRGTPAKTHSQSRTESPVLPTDDTTTRFIEDYTWKIIELNILWGNIKAFKTHVVKTYCYYLGLRATLLTEQSFCTTPVSSQLGGVASGGLRVEMGSGGLTRSIQGLCYQKHLGIWNVELDYRDYPRFRLAPFVTSLSFTALFFGLHRNTVSVSLANSLTMLTIWLLIVSVCQIWADRVQWILELFHWKRWYESTDSEPNSL